MEINQDLIMQWGLMNKLSTGNALLDTFLVMLVPLLVNQLLPYLRTFGDRVVRWQRKPPEKHHERVIEHKQKDHYYYYTSDENMPNHKLQQAIMIHLNSLPEVFSQLETADVCLAKAKRQKRLEERSNDDEDRESTSEDSDHQWYPGVELEEFEVKLVPPLDTWINIQPGLKFMREECHNTQDNKTETVTTYTLIGQTPQQVDNFIAAAYDSYRTMLKGDQRDKTADRYLYLPMLTKNEEEDHIAYRRYKLSDEKSFANFFHPEKPALLTLVDNFNQKKGKFSIQGYPQKLGFLVHGPPGTGKTTFIKALAAHTKRSIINIPLSLIKTNQQLTDMMMDERIKVEGEDMRVPLPFNKVIYVMEDIDAASHVVQKRTSPDPSLADALAALMQSPKAQPDSKGQHEHQSTAVTASSTTTTAVKVAGEATDGVVLTRATSVTHQQDVAAESAPAQPIGPSPAPKGHTAAWLSGQGLAGSDALNLAGLLNVLDGVVDTPGRIVVMSTNHPEKLDPALIRPGRINRKVYLGHIAAPEALQLIQHYFGQLTEQQQQQMLASWVNDAVSPATLEALCAEHEEVEDLLAAVQQLQAVPHAAQAVPLVQAVQAVPVAQAEQEGAIKAEALHRQRLQPGRQFQQEQQQQQQQQQQPLKRHCSGSIAIQAVSGSSAASPFVAAAAAATDTSD